MMMRSEPSLSRLMARQPKPIQHWLAVQGCAIAATVLTLWGFSSEPAKAQRELILEVPMPEQLSYSEVMSQSEQLVAEVINQRFRQNSTLSLVEIAVVGSRNGEILPLMQTVVSRSQWERDPRVVRWTDYNSVSQSLLTRPHNSGNESAVEPPPGTLSVTLEPQYLLEEAFNDGLINQEEYEILLDTLDE